MGKVKWTYEIVSELAKRCSSRYDFQKQYKNAYNVAWKQGWLDEFFNETRKPIGYWDVYENVYVEAKKVNNKRDFRILNDVAYRAALRNNWFVTFDWFINLQESICTKEHCQNVAKLCHSVNEFRTKYKKEYNHSRINNWLPIFFEYRNGKPVKTPPRQIKLTRDYCYECAKSCGYSKEMSVKFASAYNKARKMGWLKDYIWFRTPQLVQSDINAKVFCVYTYIDDINKVCYIGLTKDIKRRHCQHKKPNKQGRFDIACSYTDKKGNSQSISPNNIIGLFDSLLDNCNAMMLVLKCIMIRHNMFFCENGLKIPSSYLIQELQALGNTPQWEIQDCLNSQIGDKNQLNIYVKNKHYHYESVAWLALRTAVLAESFSPGYFRYFIHMQAKYGEYEAAWAGYDGNVLQKGRLSSDIKDLKGVTDGVYFYPKYKTPRFINLIHTTYLSIKNNSIAKRLHSQPAYIIRDSKIYRKENGYCINDARVCLTDSNGDIKTCIKQFYKDIVCDVIKYSKRQLGRYNLKKLLPIVYIRIMVYNTDMRLREYDSNGLQSSLVCTIGFNVSKHKICAYATKWSARKLRQPTIQNFLSEGVVNN